MKKASYVLLAWLGAAAAAQAQTQGLGLGYLGMTATSEVSTSLRDAPGGALLAGTDAWATGGLLYSDAQGRSFAAYCVELQQDPITEGSADFSVFRFGAGTQRLLEGLYSTHFASLSGGVQQAAFQTAVWEIVHETAAVLDVASGSFIVDAHDAGDTLTFRALANQYLADAQAFQGVSSYEVIGLSHPQYQNLVTAAPVPEPATYALLLGGLALVGAAKRRRVA